MQRFRQIQVWRIDSKELEGARRSSFSFFIIVSLWYNRGIRIESCGGEMNMMMFLKLRNI